MCIAAVEVNSFLLFCPCVVPSDVPLNVLVESLNATHAMLAWNPPLPEHQNGLIDFYIIHVMVIDTGDELQHTSVFNSTVIGPLHPFYTYKFSIAAHTVPFTTPISLQMPEAGTCSYIFSYSAFT